MKPPARFWKKIFCGLAMEAEVSLLRNPEMSHLLCFMNKPDIDKDLLVAPSVNQGTKSPCKEEVEEVT